MPAFKIHRRVAGFFAAISIVILLLAACESFNIFSIQDDKMLGAQLNDEIVDDPQQYPILRNALATKYLQDMVDEILKSPHVQYEGTFAYDVKIIDKDNVINAFCTPGGYIYVYTGLIKYLDYEATMAGVLAHEIAHAEMRHSTQRMTKAYGMQVLANLALGENPDQTEEIAANLFSGLALLKNSRGDEYEADKYSVKYLYSTGKWYPGAIKYFFDKMGDKAQNDAFKTMLSTHPLGPDRVEKVNELLKKLNVPPPTEKNLGYRRYKEFKKMVQ